MPLTSPAVGSHLSQSLIDSYKKPGDDFLFSLSARLQDLFEMVSVEVVWEAAEYLGLLVQT